MAFFASQCCKHRVRSPFSNVVIGTRMPLQWIGNLTRRERKMRVVERSYRSDVVDKRLPRAVQLCRTSPASSITLSCCDSLLKI